jgi:hypothetical protein
MVVAFSALCATAGIQLAGAPEAVLGDEDGDARSIANERRRRSWRHRPGGRCSLLPAATYGAKVCWGTASEAVERRDKTVG